LLFQAFSSVFLLAADALETPLRSSTAVSSAADGASQAAPSRGGTELLLKTSREQSLCLGLDPFGSESVPGAMFLKGGEVRVSCDVLATEVIEDLLERGVLPPGREVAAQIPVELPSAKLAVVPKNRSRSTATRCSRGRDVGRPGRHRWRRPGGETAPAARTGAASTGT